MFSLIKLVRLTFIIGFVGTLAACASEEEKQERRENAYDISGPYKSSVSEGSEVGLLFEIRNETGRHDIVVDMERVGEYTQGERNFLNFKGIDPNAVINHFGNTMTLGVGYNSLQLEGGENISTDFGESSRFSVCGPGYKYDSSYTLKYCLSGTVNKKDKKMKGHLSLHSTKEEIKFENGKQVKTYTTDQIKMYFESNADLVFYKQYMGAWTGDVYKLTSKLNMDHFSSMVLSNTQGDELYASISPSTFEYLGEVYNYLKVESLMSLEEIKSQDYPAIHMVFKSQTSDKKITVFGQIWSLGEFTGSVVHESGDSYEELATFRFKKI